MICRGDETNIKELIGDSGTLSIVYGGYEIRVIDQKNFRWAEIMEWLLKCGCEVYVFRKNDYIIIKSKQCW